MPSTEAGVVVGIGDQLYFAPAVNVRVISEQPPITPVPGTALGIALIDGRVVAVLTLGPRQGPLLLCDESGEQVALSGLTVLGSGEYPVEDSAVLVDGRRVARLDVASRVTAAAEARQGVDAG